MPAPRVSLSAVFVAALALVGGCGSGTLGSRPDSGAAGRPDAGAAGSVGITGAAGTGGGAACGPVCEIFCAYGNVVDEHGCPTCACNPGPACDGTTPERCTASVPPICDCDPGRFCGENDCGPPAPFQPTICVNGSTGLVECVRNDDRRTCSWRVRPCPPSALEQSLQAGAWLTHDLAGDCVQLQAYLRFFGNGQAERVVIDNDACQPSQRGTRTTSVVYTLKGRTLTMSEGSTTREFAVATGDIASTRLMFVEVYEPISGATWRGSSTSESLEAGAVVQRTTVNVELRFTAPVPTSGSGDCTADVAFTVEGYTQRDQFGGDLPVDQRETIVTGTLAGRACRYGPSPQGQQIEFIGGLDFSAQPNWAMNRLTSMAPGRLWLNPAEPEYLFKSGWYFHRDALPASP